MTRPVDTAGTDLVALTDRLVSWDGSDDVHRFGVTDDFWERMRQNMAFTPHGPGPDSPANLDRPFEPDPRPGERLGPTLAELARSRSPGLLAPLASDSPEAYAQRLTEREARFPDWPWHEGGGVRHVYS